MDKQQVQVDRLFETSWEVCNKIGGIYTVLSTKAQTLQNLFKDKTIFIGPDVWSDDSPSPYFKEIESLLKDWRRKANLPDGVSVRVGRWQVPGKPIVVLVKFDGVYRLKDELYGKMWELYGVDSLHAYGDYDEGCCFALAAGMVIKSICEYEGLNAPGKNVVAHFDEWTTGMGLLYTKWQVPSAATVFTTHATSIGRSICSNGKQLYDYLKGYNGDQMARELNMEAKHSVEKTAAHQADCFTTVSEITAIECEQLLELRPRVVTPNGFEAGFVPGPRKLPEVRKESRAALLRAARSLTGVKFDDRGTFVVATSGRCEYCNKGIDVYIDSMRLLATMNPSKRVLAFICVPAWSREARTDLQHNMQLSRPRRLADPFLTHWLNNPDEDPINRHVHSAGLANTEDERVTIVYVPCYLDAADGIFNRPYYEILAGMDVTVFPSYYEPWGYTPLESVAFGVPTVTTSLSGFGRWILDGRGNGMSRSGVEVVQRTDGNYSEVVSGIAHTVKRLIETPLPERGTISAEAMATADAAAWQYFIVYYAEAYAVALDNARERCAR